MSDDIEVDNQTEDSYKQLISNQEAFLQIRKAEWNRLRGIPCDDEKAQPGSEVSSNFGWLELGSTYEWSGSESSSIPSFSQNEFHVHDSIEAIREEAAKIDTIMALDQLDTIKQELGSVKKILQARRMEVHELRDQLSLRDDLLSTLELERDLYKAEVVKLKDQLEHSQSEGAAVPEDSEPSAVHVTAIHGIDNTGSLALVPEASSAPIPLFESDDFVASLVSPAPQTYRLGLHRPIFRDGSNDEVVVNQIKGKDDCRSCFFVPRVLFRKKRRPESRNENIRELGRLLRTSMDANEGLRKRIATLSAYYETVVERVQGSLNEAHVERQRVATDLAKQIVAMDKDHRRAVDELERRLQHKERELAAYKEAEV